MSSAWSDVITNTVLLGTPTYIDLPYARAQPTSDLPAQWAVWDLFGEENNVPLLVQVPVWQTEYAEELKPLYIQVHCILQFMVE